MRPTQENLELLNFDRDRFIAIQAGAVSIGDELHDRLGDALSSGIERLYVLGTGGAQLLMLPAIALLEQHSALEVHASYPAEIVLETPPGLDRKALVLIPSLSGTTKESVKAIELCRERGATTLTLTGHRETPLAQEADLNYTNFAEDDTSSESFYLQSLILALSILEHRGERAGFAETVAQLRLLPELLADAKAAFEEQHAAAIAEAINAANYHIFTAAGTAWPEAHYYAMCILEEMQWIATRPVHAADFFHGTLELVEPDVSVFVLKGEDAQRPLAERVERFTARYTTRLNVIDTADVALPGVTDDVRRLISPVVLATVLERVSAHLEVLRDHPLTTRRYYKRVAY
jgi:fructoselysine-6-phosphate deglycase